MHPVRAFLARGAAFVARSLGWAFVRGLDVDGGGGGAGKPGQLTQPMAHSVWVMRAILRVAEPIAAVPLRFSTSGRGTEQELRDPVLAEFWENPFQGAEGPMSREDAVLALVGWLCLAGEAFVVLDDTWLAASFAARSRPVLVRPDRMQPIMDGEKVAGWTYTDARQRRHTLLIEQVVHLKRWNPYDPVRGLAPMLAAQTAAETDYLAGQFARSLAANNGDRGPFIIAKSGVPSDEQREMIVRALREKKAASARGDFKPVFLTGDITIEDPAIKAPDADWVAQRKENRYEIFIAFGVPPGMADLVTGRSIGTTNDHQQLIQDTCIPMGRLLTGAIEQLSRRLRPGKAAPLFAWFDFDEHPVMQEVRRSRLTAAGGLWDRGWSWEAINSYLGLRLPKFPGWDRCWVPFGLTQLDASGNPQDALHDAPPAGEAKMRTAFTRDAVLSLEKQVALADKLSKEMPDLQLGLDPVQQMLKALRAPRQLGARAGRIADKASEPAAVVAKIDDPARAELWKKLMRKRSPAIARCKVRVDRELAKIRSVVIRKIDAAAVQRAPTQRAAAADFLFDPEAFRQALVATMRSQSQKVLGEAGQQLFEELGRDDVFTMPPERVLRFLDGRENLIKGAADDIFEGIKRSLNEGISAGDTMAELAERVRRSFTELSTSEATRIAMTETAAAYGDSRQAAMEQAGVSHKEWLTSRNGNVRDAHRAAEGQVVQTDEAFTVGGEALMGPGDPHGSAANVINCHCVSIAVDAPTKPK